MCGRNNYPGNKKKKEWPVIIMKYRPAEESALLAGKKRTLLSSPVPRPFSSLVVAFFPRVNVGRLCVSLFRELESFRQKTEREEERGETVRERHAALSTAKSSPAEIYGGPRENFHFSLDHSREQLTYPNGICTLADVRRPRGTWIRSASLSLELRVIVPFIRSTAR